ncbi:hypothetical protein PIB30_090094 [Stylosanthes scabra]|uniref:Transposase MuDR plant domain-containing protein n=1 Tax=Stylosanthes scabra TaxID=79078 RepID=A0ABU6SVM0_9FABA|nr:hypothetical protein [Stylosanthes scabra]
MLNLLSLLANVTGTLTCLIITFPSIIYNELEAGDCVGELGDTVTVAPHALTVLAVQREPDPLVDETLLPDDSDDEPPFIDGDSDDDSGPGEPSSGTQGSQGLNNQAKFEIGQTFMDKEVVVLAVKNYSIRRGVEYRVMESDHAKYLRRCKQFGQGCNWLIRLTFRRRKGV